MKQLQIRTPQMQEIFETKFHSNQDKFMEFIVTFIKDNSKMVDNYFNKLDTSTECEKIQYKKLNPMENYYQLSVDENDKDMTNPFRDVEDSVEFAKKLRESSQR